MNARIASGGQKPVKTAIKAGWLRARRVLALCAVLLLGLIAPAYAQEQGQLFATQEEGYGRLILSFPGRDSLPKYEMRIENGVLSIEFVDQVSIILPDVSSTMPDYLSVARVDPDGRGLRIGLRTAFSFNRIEAGEKLFIDLLPTSWQGMPPALPQAIIDELAERARVAAIRAEQERKAAGVADLDPKATIRVGRNPTFLRVQFDWSVPTTGDYVQEGELGLISFEWPVGVDLRDLAIDLPPEIVSVESAVNPDGSVITLQLAEGIKPRFYENSPRQYIMDIDIAGIGLPTFDTASLADGVAAEAEHGEVHETPADPLVGMLYPESASKTVTPFISVLGSTVRVVFPFEQDTPAAVFRRGDTVWMMFDTISGIAPPPQSDALDALASEFAVVTAGDTQMVRVELSQDRLATLGSEGMAWVLSLGDIMLTPTEPIELSRRRDAEGDFEIVADVARPARVHDFRDPVVGDVLKVVTAFPPARGVTRTLDYVDFSALRSVHGLVIKPETLDLDVTIENDLAVLSTSGGLTVSALDGPRTIGNGIAEAMRGSFIDLAQLEQPDFGLFTEHKEELLAEAAATEGRDRDIARLDLAQYYIANHFGLEAIGVLDVLETDLKAEDLTRKVRLSRAIADTIAGRSADALQILNSTSMGQEVDALLWRTIARADAYDYKGAKMDALEAATIVDTYPRWVRSKFQFAAIRAAVETGDTSMAQRLLDEVDFAGLDAADSSLYHLLSGRIDEAQGRIDEAIDTYGQVITADIRPTRAEAIYRTLLLLDQSGKLNLAKGTETLSAESLLWRGNPLEADMQKLLAELYFRHGDYRLGFETVKQAVANYPESPPINALRDEAQRMFGELFLNGMADAMGPVDALGLYYDFRQLTPPGARGDEMIRNLARRLVRVDLLPQAAELLEYQLDNRLRGVARTQIAADLAIIYLADRKPQDALRVLNATRLPDIPESLARQRRILEARAMIDGGRDQLALDLLRDLDGRDATLLRIDAHWKARRYAQASEMIEALYAENPGTALTQPARMSVIKAAVGFVLAGDTFGLSRLRSKFGDAMVTSPEWPMFDLVTGNVEVTSLEFKTVANQVAGTDGINSFLSSYRETYGGEGALAPTVASEPDAGIASVGAPGGA
ncbi:tetratricopeptide repeat protein [Devosia sp. SL43]|uniref:tetratricopeptide repeat protein n=1 Tax=Devosia sp. SL43 TaxID=2806348 RepID=UPI001F19AA42|nr:tetratricopeptide repeat protein [Devosia sp. SL43]UJW86614.1 tetratricopeptide repeat protein [Devosia sp. SL43]